MLRDKTVEYERIRTKSGNDYLSNQVIRRSLEHTKNRQHLHRIYNHNAVCMVGFSGDGRKKRVQSSFKLDSNSLKV